MMNTEHHQLSAGALGVWRFLRDEGGYWTAGEVARAMQPQGHQSMASGRAARWLGALARRQFVVDNPRALRVAAYGVTPRCLVPAGESLAPLASSAAAGGQA